MSLVEKGNEVFKERIENLLDVGSYVELCASMDAAKISTGYGTIDGHLVYIYSQADFINLNHAKKIQNLYRFALKMGAPIIGILDSEGIDIEEGLETLEALGMIFSIQSEARGVIPQISVILGKCMGTLSYIAGLSDFVFMLDKDSKLFVESPNVYNDGKFVTFEATGDYHSIETGVAHFSYNSESNCIEGVKKLLSYLPSNNMDIYSANICTDDLNRVDHELNTILNNEDNNTIKKIIKTLADNGEYLEISESYAKNAVISLCRFGGYTAGIVANNGKLEPQSIEKIINFIKFCDSYSIPIVNLINAEGYNNTIENDNKILKWGAELIKCYYNSTVPKINVILKKAIGSPYLIMNSKHIGADIVYAWQNSEISAIDKESAKKVLNTDIDSNAYVAASKGYIDQIIEPSSTRKMILVALEMLASKKVFGNAKR